MGILIMGNKTPEEILKELEEENNSLKQEQPERREKLKALRLTRDELKTQKEEKLKALEAEKEENKKLKLNDDKIKSLTADIEVRVNKLTQTEKTEPTEHISPPPPPPPPTTKVESRKNEQARGALLGEIRSPQKLKKVAPSPSKNTGQPKRGLDMKEVLERAMKLTTKTQETEEKKEEKQESLEKKIASEQRKNNMYKQEQKTIQNIESEITELSKPINSSLTEKYTLPKEYAIHSTEALEVYKADQEILIVKLESRLQELAKLEEQRSQAIAQKKQAEENINTKQKEMLEDEVPKPIGEAPPPPPAPPLVEPVDEAFMPPPPPPPPTSSVPQINIFAKKQSQVSAPPSTEQTASKARALPSDLIAEIQKQGRKTKTEKDAIVLILRSPDHQNYKIIMEAFGTENQAALNNTIKDVVDDMLENDPKLKTDLEYAKEWKRRQNRASQENEQIKFTRRELNDPRVKKAIGEFFDALSDDQKTKLVDAYNQTQPKQETETVAPSKAKDATVANTPPKAEKKEIKKTPGGLLETKETLDLLKKVEKDLQTAKEKVEAEKKEADDLTKKGNEHLAHLGELGPKVTKREAVSERLEDQLLAHKSATDIPPPPPPPPSNMAPPPSTSSSSVVTPEKQKTPDKILQKIYDNYSQIYGKPQVVPPKDTTPETTLETKEEQKPVKQQDTVTGTGLKTTPVDEKKEEKQPDSYPYPRPKDYDTFLTKVANNFHERIQRDLKEKTQIQEQTKTPVQDQAPTQDIAPGLSDEQISAREMYRKEMRAKKIEKEMGARDMNKQEIKEHEKKMRTALNKVNAAAVYMLIEDQYKKNSPLQDERFSKVKRFFKREATLESKTIEGVLKRLELYIKYVYTNDKLLNKQKALLDGFNTFKENAMKTGNTVAANRLIEAMNTVIKEIEPDGRIREKKDAKNTPYRPK